MEYIIQGKGNINLNKKDFLASGGEGDIYIQGLTAYKIYQDPKKAIPEGKIKELSVLSLPNIIKPESTLLDKNGKNCGYSMKYVRKDDTFILCELFTKTFKSQNQFTPLNTINLIKRFRETIQHCHDKNILVVDLNEMNYLVAKNYKEIYAIDTDSYQTPSYKATAIMESIRDRHNKTFTNDTDWFSFGVVTFNLFTGIHPYKGKHHTYNGFEERMVHNISVFNKDVKVPPIVDDFTQTIPKAYYDWYEAIFEKGIRCAPPIDFIQTFMVPRKIQIVKGSDNFTIDKVYTCTGGDVIKIFLPNMVLNGKGLAYGPAHYNDIAPYAHIIIEPKTKEIYSFIVSQNKLKVVNISKNIDVPCDLKASG